MSVSAPGRDAGPASAADRLRSHTRGKHRALDDRVRVHERVASRAGYADLLAFFAAGVGPVERWLLDHPLIAGVPGWPDRAGSPLLHADLRTLGRESPVEAGHFPPPDETEAGLLGVVYVLEGSALGGLLIAKLARRSLGVTAGTGASYFGRDADDPTGPWERFKSHLNARVRDDAARRRAAAAADRVFDHFLARADTLR